MPNFSDALHFKISKHSHQGVLVHLDDLWVQLLGFTISWNPLYTRRQLEFNNTELESPGTSPKLSQATWNLDS